MRYISRVIVLAVAGLVTYVLFPEAPPWLASRDGYITQHVARLSARGWIYLHAGNLNHLLATAQADGSNPVAAMPSLHTAFATLVAIFIAGRFTSRWRYLLVLYPAAMGFALVYLGEHYVIDLAAGVAYALAVHFALNRWERRRGVRRRMDTSLTNPLALPIDAVVDLDELAGR
jgi:membrane-associated phospholipid phosphatase